MATLSRCHVLLHHLLDDHGLNGGLGRSDFIVLILLLTAETLLGGVVGAEIGTANWTSLAEGVNRGPGFCGVVAR